MWNNETAPYSFSPGNRWFSYGDSFLFISLHVLHPLFVVWPSFTIIQSIAAGNVVFFTRMAVWFLRIFTVQRRIPNNKDKCQMLTFAIDGKTYKRTRHICYQHLCIHSFSGNKKKAHKRTKNVWGDTKKVPSKVYCTFLYLILIIYEAFNYWIPIRITIYGQSKFEVELFGDGATKMSWIPETVSEICGNNFSNLINQYKYN